MPVLPHVINKLSQRQLFAIEVHASLQSLAQLLIGWKLDPKTPILELISQMQLIEDALQGDGNGHIGDMQRHVLGTPRIEIRRFVSLEKLLRAALGVRFGSRKMEIGIVEGAKRLLVAKFEFGPFAKNLLQDFGERQIVAVDGDVPIE